MRMSKYIKLEDALKGLNMGYGKYDYVSKVADYYNNLPTIEVSENAISREWLLEEYQKGKEKISESERFAELMWLVKHAPSVIPKPEEGEWVSNHDGYWICSECGLSFLFYAKGNYCPNCGANMRGGKDD